MNLLSVNLGKEQPLNNGKPSGTSGIFKYATTDSVQITREGLASDIIVDLNNHGGVDQTVYVYGSPDYAWWAKELEQELLPGTFGENLTISDLECSTLYIGDLLHVGQVVLQVTGPRIPCATLAARMGDPKFVKRFRFGERPGVYCRVLETGTVTVGDTVSIESYRGDKYSVLEMFRAWYAKEQSEDEMRRQLAAPIAIRARQVVEERLATLLQKQV
jgi:MOSC domain-containing protein YiiM